MEEGGGGGVDGMVAAELWNLTNSMFGQQVWCYSQWWSEMSHVWNIIQLASSHSRWIYLFSLKDVVFKVIVVSTHWFDWRVLILSFCASYRGPCIVFVILCFSSTFQLYFMTVKGRISIGVLGGLRFLKEMMQNRKWMNTKAISNLISHFKNRTVK